MYEHAVKLYVIMTVIKLIDIAELEFSSKFVVKIKMVN